MTSLRDDLAGKMILYRIKNRKYSEKKMAVTQSEIDELIKSLTTLQSEYKDLFKIIENDPQLKKYVEDKIIENKKTKI
jgi:hypothetical protein